MTKAVVIKTYGDPRFTDPIQRAIETVEGARLNSEELAVVKAENEQLKAAKAKQDARDGVRAYGDGLRWPTVAGGMAIKYTVPRHGPVYNAILIAWASLWIVIFDWFHYFQAWNREG